MITKIKNDFTFVFFPLQEFSKENFINFIVNNFKLYSTYSILIKLSFDNQLTFKMSGDQIGLVINNRHDVSYYENLYQVIKTRIDLTTDNYNLSYNLDGLELMYTVINPLPELYLKNISNLELPKNLTNVKETKNKFNNKLLPLTTDVRYYGKPLSGDIKSNYINKINQNFSLLNNKNNTLITFNEDLFLNQIKTENLIISSQKISDNVFIRQVFNESTGILLVKAIDTIYNSNLFERNINNVTLTIENNKIIKVKICNNLKTISNNSFIKNVKAVSERNKQFGTFDLETFIDSDGLSKVYALGFTTNMDLKPNLYYLTDVSDNLDFDLLILTCIDKMLVRKYNNFIFYTHNFGRFDCIFIFNVLKKANIIKGFDYYNLKTTIRDETIIKLDIKIKKKTSNKSEFIKISIVDSLNLLNNSLDKLTKDFNVNIKKGIFPYNFVNKDNLNYVGNTPDMIYYNNLNLLEYNKICKEKWDLKQESLSYLEADLLSHLSVMNEFSKTLYQEFNIQLTDSLTISRLALNIFLKRYLKDSKIPLINNYNIFNFIKSGYYGGITEVYKPFGRNLIYIDVNSLYPFAALNPMPGMICEYIETFEELGLDLNSLFGFFYAKVKTKDNIPFGLLPVKTDKGLIFPQGEFTGVWCSEELKYAKENGYDITVIKGYNFNKVDSFFNLFVRDLYEMKSKNTGSLKMTAKSILNNLLGRFGLTMIKPLTKVVNKENRDYIASTRKVISQKFITENDFLLTFNPIISKDICEQHGLDYLKVLTKEKKNNIEYKANTFKDISVVIPAFITSYARIFMNEKKLEILKKGGVSYYTDTDSLVLDKTYINKSWIGDKIGEFKLEHDVKEAYFISNKTYCLLLNNNKVIIKAKGVLNNSLTLEDFKNMYFKQININTMRSNTITNYEEGSVNIGTTSVTLSFDSYTKRTKIYNSEGLWVDTKPIIINNKI